MEKEIVTQNKNDKSVREIEVNLAPLLVALAKKIWIIILVAVITAGATFVASKMFLKPTYRSYFTAYVNNQTQQTSRESLSSVDTQASKDLVKTYSKVLTRNSVLIASAEFSNIDMEQDALSSSVTTEIEDETEIITVYVETPSAQNSYKLAQAIAHTSPTYMAQIIDGSSMRIIDPPQLSTKRYRPNYVSIGIVGGFVGALAAIVIVLIRYFKDDSVKSEGDLEGRFGFPVIGIIPNSNDLRSSGDYSSYYNYSSYYGSYAQATKHANDTDKKKGGRP